MADDGKAIGSTSNDPIQLARTEGSSAAQEKYAFEETRFSGRIRPGNQRELWIKPQIDVAKTAQILELDRKERHQQAQRRIGMTT